MEDVAAIVITSFSASIHSRLLLDAARHGIALIICESFKPASLVLPANRSTDTLLTRAQLDLKKADQDRLWNKTINAKTKNQLSLARIFSPDHRLLPTLEMTVRGRKPHKEALCARMFWQIFASGVVGSTGFTRNRDGKAPNNLLNYGYAILLSTVLQKCFAIGLDPTFGIDHAVREHATPLAYDLMEPFRPCVDWRVAQWIGEHPDPDEWKVTKEFRAWVTGFPLEKIEYLDLSLDIRGCIEGVVRSFRKAVIQKQTGLYRPWTQKNSKWVG
jgi:CRISPR-associated protein Cas1